MTDYPNPDPRAEDQDEHTQSVKPRGGLEPLPADGREDDAVQVFERPTETGTNGSTLIYIFIGLIFLLLVGYLAYQFLF